MYNIYYKIYNITLSCILSYYIYSIFTSEGLRTLMDQTQHDLTSTAGCLCAYDARQGSLLRIWPRSGEAEAFQLTLASHGAVKLQPWHGELLIYAEGGQERSWVGETCGSPSSGRWQFGDLERVVTVLCSFKGRSGLPFSQWAGAGCGRHGRSGSQTWSASAAWPGKPWNTCSNLLLLHVAAWLPWLQTWFQHLNVGLLMST